MKPTKMSRFTCHSQASTAVCITGDPRSVIVPRSYSRLMETQRLTLGDKRSTALIPSRFGDKRSAAPISSRRDRNGSKPSNLPNLSTSSKVFQVVVMRVSLHCQGCAGKVKKHLSKMEGVTSFSIDLESKRVTVMGHVSPLMVLESISKVKKAEFWPC